MSTSINPPGRIVTRPLSDGTVRIKVFEDEAAKIKSISPVPTVWGREDGRPIYDRLPGVAEGYKKEYFSEVGRGLVYIDPQFGTTTGEGSLQVGAWSEDSHVIIVESGTITWAYGTIETETLAIDLRLIDGEEGLVQDGDYQIGYYLDYEQQAIQKTSIFEVENASLGSSVSLYRASSTARNHPVTAMFSETDTRSWKPSLFSLAGTYSEGESVIIDFSEPVKANTFTLTAEDMRSSRATCALYRSDDGIVWLLEDSRKARDGAWTLIPGTQSRHRYWRFFFWDGTVSVFTVSYSGEAVFQNLRPVGPIGRVEPFLEGKFDQIDRAHIVLANITVKDRAVVRVTDNRKISAVKYEPVAAWLTDFQDTTLRRIFESVQDYSGKFLSPISGADGIYDELLDSGFAIGDGTETGLLKLPSSIELEPGWSVVSEADLLSDPHARGVSSDPGGFQVIAEGVSFFRSDSSIRPSSIILLGNPERESDLVNLGYVEKSLTLNLDNGIYS